MVQVAKFIIIFVWVFQALVQELAWLFWWQVKEYRLDRFRLLFESRDGRENLYIPEIIAKLTVLVILLFLDLNRQLELFLVFILLFLVSTRVLIQQSRKGLKRPVPTARVLIILCLFLFSAASIFAIFVNRDLVSFILLQEIFLILSPVLGILITAPFIRIMKNREITKAKKILDKIRPSVIGITGSYGKTTTKDFLAQLLSQKYQTAKTEGSENTELGIARKTVKNVTYGTKFFVVEMGAYKIGEIRTLAKIARPRLGVITGVNEQHLALFGSKQNIIKAKFELIESLPEGGIAVFNYSNPDCLEMAKIAAKLKTELKVYGYLLENKKSSIRADLKGRVISTRVDGVEFEVIEKGRKLRLFASIPGPILLENLLGAILVARLLGVSWEEISRGCRSLELPAKTMRIYKLSTGALVVDDSFNTNPRGFEAALEFLKGFTGKRKAVITPGIIELGEKSGEIHRRLAGIISRVADKVILTNRDFAESFRIGLAKNPSSLRVLSDIKDLREEFLNLIGSKYIILLEGRVPSILTETLKEFEK